jgi:hypothetical protein
VKKLSQSLLVLSLLLTCSCITSAQENSQGSESMPKVLQITREFVKPGKAGAIHDLTESAFVRDMASAKWPTHYLGMTSMSGKSRALFLTGYDSFAAWEKDSEAAAKDAALSAELDRDSMVDGQLLDSMDQGVFVFDDEMSLRPVADVSHMRYMQVETFHIREGHVDDWTAAVKLVKAAYEKAVPDAHWAMYEQMYGGDGGTYLVLISHKTLAEIDQGLLENKQFLAAMGEEGMKKLNDLSAASIESSQNQLFEFDAHMSYVPAEWIQSDPDFWKP